MHRSRSRPRGYEKQKMPTQETLGLTAEIRAPRALPALKISTEKTTILGSKLTEVTRITKNPTSESRTQKLKKMTNPCKELKIVNK